MITEERPKQDDIYDVTYEKYIDAEVMMDVPEEGLRRATVRRRVEYLDEKKLGKYHQNPLMDTRKYKLEYDDGIHDCYFSNVIFKNLYLQVESERQFFLYWNIYRIIRVTERISLLLTGL